MLNTGLFCIKYHVLKSVGGGVGRGARGRVDGVVGCGVGGV